MQFFKLLVLFSAWLKGLLSNKVNHLAAIIAAHLRAIVRHPYSENMGFLSTAQIWAALRPLNGLLYCLTIPTLAIANQNSYEEIRTTCHVRNAVHALTGKFFLHQVDTISPGFEPIPIERSYISENELSAEGGWVMFPHDRFFVEHGLDPFKEKKFTAILSIQEPSGQTIRYTCTNPSSSSNPYIFTPDVARTYDPRFQGEMSGRTDPRNNVVSIDFRRKHESTATLILGSGGRRIYKRKPGERIPFLLQKEIKPNGNVVIYEHDKDHRLKSILSFNASQTKQYAKATFHYENANSKKNRNFIVKLNDHREIRYSFMRPSSQFEWIHDCFYLEQVTGHGIVPWKYHYDLGYDEGGKHPEIYDIPRGAFIKEVESAGQSILKLSYYKPKENYPVFWPMIKIKKASDLPCDLVKDLSEPIDGGYQATHSFIYSKKSPISKGATKIKDALGNETEYTYGTFGKITEITFFGPNRKILRSEQFSWTGNDLTLHALIDPNRQASFAHGYQYDSRGNVKAKTLYGNLTGTCSIPLDTNHLNNGIESYTTAYEYSNNGFNLLTKKVEQNGLTTLYDYVPNTNLLQSEHVYQDDILLMHSSFLYNDGFLTEKLIEHGPLRKITRLTPNSHNYPEKIEEYGVDSITGKEELTSAKHFEYYPSPNHHLIHKETFIDSEGNKKYSIERIYDEADHVVTEKIDPLNAVTTWNYDSRYFLKDRQKPEGPKEAFDYFSNGLLKAHTQNDHVTSYTYDALHHKKSATDPYNVTTTFQSDRFGNPVQIALEHSLQRNEYDFWGRPIAQTDPKGFATITTFNARGQPIRIEHPTGIELFIYTLKGNLKEHIDLDGTKTVYEYDPLDRPLKKAIFSPQNEPFGEEIKTYEGPLLISETDLEGYITQYKYDCAGRKVEETREGRKIQITYDSMGALRTRTQGDLTIITERDPFGRIEKEERRDLKGTLLELTQWKYNKRGLAEEEIRQIAGKESTFLTKYDPFDRIVESTDPLGFKTTASYALNPHTKTTIDPLNRKKIETYNTKGKIARLERQDRLGHPIALEKYEYDLNNNLTKQTSTIYFQGKVLKSIDTQWHYGASNRLEEWIEALGSPIERRTAYEYTPKGLLKTVTKPDQTQLYYEYDPLGSQTRLKSSDQSIHYFYEHNHLGQLISVTDLNSGAKTTRIVDPFGQILKEHLANGFCLSTSYTPLGQPKIITLPDATTIEKTYQGTHLKEIIRPLYTHKFTEYDLSGNLLTEELPFNSGHILYDLDPAGRYKQVRAPPFLQTIDEFDPLGKIKKLTTQGAETLFDYDELGQLTAENKETFEYDSHYNRLSHNDQTYEVDDLHQLKKTNKAEFTHDTLGNVQTKTTLQGALLFHYDPLDRLIYLKNNEGVETFYTYDPLHRRLTKTTNGITTRFLYDGQKEIGFEKQGQLSLRILGDTPFAEIGSAVALELNGKIYLPINDLQGNIALLYDPNTKTTLEETKYSAFGVASAPSTINPWRYLSKHADDESRLIYFGRRYYDPTVGRWLTTDPKGYTDSMNLYAFALNDPFLLVDPYGLSSIASTPACSTLPNVSFNGVHEKLWTSINPLQKGSGSYDLGLPEKSDHHRIVFINGIWNDFSSSRESSTYVSNLAGGYNVHFIYNASFGKGVDLSECYMGLNYVATAPVLHLQNKFNQLFADCPASATFLLIAHSQGAIHARNYLLLCPDEQRSRIQVVAIAPAAYIYKETCASVAHYRAASVLGDLVPRIDRPGAQRAAQTIVNLQSQSFNPLPMSLHPFQSNIYTQSIHDEIQSYYRESAP